MSELTHLELLRERLPAFYIDLNMLNQHRGQVALVMRAESERRERLIGYFPLLDDEARTSAQPLTEEDWEQVWTQQRQAWVVDIAPGRATVDLYRINPGKWAQEVSGEVHAGLQELRRWETGVHLTSVMHWDPSVPVWNPRANAFSNPDRGAACGHRSTPDRFLAGDQTAVSCPHCLAILLREQRKAYRAALTRSRRLGRGRVPLLSTEGI